MGPAFLLCGSSWDSKGVAGRGALRPSGDSPPTHPLEGDSSWELSLCHPIPALPSRSIPAPPPLLASFLILVCTYSMFVDCFWVCLPTRTGIVGFTIMPQHCSSAWDTGTLNKQSVC